MSRIGGPVITDRNKPADQRIDDIETIIRNLWKKSSDFDQAIEKINERLRSGTDDKTSISDLSDFTNNAFEESVLRSLMMSEI